MKRRTLLIVSLLAIVPLLVAASKAYNGALHMLNNAFNKIEDLEPDRVGSLHDVARGRSAIIHNPTPAVRFVSPLNGQTLQSPLQLKTAIANWEVAPEYAVNANTQFANGHQEYNTGHTHTWIYNSTTGARVRFTGATGLQLDPGTGLYVSSNFTLAPGVYKAYVQLQNHDHTGPIPAVAPDLPPFDAVEFVVAP